MDALVTLLDATTEPEVELVEHKGAGHPDSICDALAERLSVSLSDFYLRNFGAVLHHNVDKALLCGGASRPRFGGGEVLAPMEIFLAGRATREVDGVAVPVEELAVEGSRAWLRDHLHALRPAEHAALHCLVRPGSADLVDLYRRGARSDVWLANDTSCGAGYAPLSELERVMLGVADRLETLAASRETPEVGEDTKLLGIRRGRRIQLTVACAFVDAFVRDLSHYVERSSRLAADLSETAAAIAGRPVDVLVNAADDVATGSVYLTVTGTSAEAGDDGQVGRGNRVNRLIAPYRPMTLEAAAGKNPVAHVGKLYNVAAHRIAASVVASVPGVTYCECHLASRIGQPIVEPEVVDVRVRLERGVALADVSTTAREVVHRGVAGIGSLWREIVRAEVRLF